MNTFEGVIPRGAFRVTLFRQYGHLTRIAERMRLMHAEIAVHGSFCFLTPRKTEFIECKGESRMKKTYTQSAEEVLSGLGVGAAGLNANGFTRLLNRF